MNALAPVLEETGLFEQGMASLLLRRILLRFRKSTGEPKPLDPARRLRIDVAWSLAIGLAVHDPLRALGYHTIALCEAFDARDPLRLARSFAAEATFLSTIAKRRPRRAIELLDEAERLAGSIDEPAATAFVIGARGIEASMTGRWREAADRCEQAEAIFLERCTAVAWDLGTVRHFGLLGRLMLGDLDHLRRRVPIVVRDAVERGDTYIACYLDGSFTSFMEGIVKNAPDETLRIAEDAIGRWPSKRFTAMQFWSTWNRVSAHLYREDARALEEVEQLFRAAAATDQLRVRHGRIEATYSRARAHVLAKNRNAALADARWLAREPQPRARGYAHLIRAAAGVSAQAELEAAIRELDAAEMKLHSAAARRGLGMLRGGDTGRTMVDEADAFMRAEGVVDPVRFAKMLAPI
jgi:hypothetical protein